MKIRWKNIVQPDRPQLTIMRMRIACWTPKATNTHSVYVTLTAFVCPFSVLLQIPLLRVFQNALIMKFDYVCDTFRSTIHCYFCGGEG